MDRLLRKAANEKLYNLYFHNGDFLGSGAIGAIFKVIHTETGEEVAAAKRVNLKKYSNFNAKKMTEQEVCFFLMIKQKKIK